MSACFETVNIIMKRHENFNIRSGSYEPLMLSTEDFDELQCKEYFFSSDKGQKLAGYLYRVGNNQHNSYIDVANYFAMNGYFVFVYDATGCDKSEGEGVGGVSQGVIDLDYAISFVEDHNAIPELTKMIPFKAVE